MPDTQGAPAAVPAHGQGAHLRAHHLRLLCAVLLLAQILSLYRARHKAVSSFGRPRPKGRYHDSMSGLERDGEAGQYHGGEASGDKFSAPSSKKSKAKTKASTQSQSQTQSEAASHHHHHHKGGSNAHHNTTNVKASSSKARASKPLKGSAEESATPLRSEKDEYLVQSKLAGMTYKEIRKNGGFTEAESTPGTIPCLEDHAPDHGIHLKAMVLEGRHPGYHQRRQSHWY